MSRVSGRAARARESTQLAVAIILVSNHKSRSAPSVKGSLTIPGLNVYLIAAATYSAAGNYYIAPRPFTPPRGPTRVGLVVLARAQYA